MGGVPKVRQWMRLKPRARLADGGILFRGGFTVREDVEF